jgi:hypothetical protein
VSISVCLFVRFKLLHATISARSIINTKMSNVQETRQALIDHKVITDVLPGNLDLSYELTVKWPKATLSKAGEELDREETQSEPSLYLNPTVR